VQGLRAAVLCDDSVIAAVSQRLLLPAAFPRHAGILEQAQSVDGGAAALGGDRLYPRLEPAYASSPAPPKPASARDRRRGPIVAHDQPEREMIIAAAGIRAHVVCGAK